MNSEKMTTTLQEAIAEAQQVAMTRKHQRNRHCSFYGRSFYSQIILAVIYIQITVSMQMRLNK